MIALRLVYLIENHSDELVDGLLAKIERSAHTREMRKVPAARRALQGVNLQDFCWALVLMKEHLWEFLNRQGFTHSSIELYGELELLRLLDQFFDRAVCYATDGYQRAAQWTPAVAAHAAR